MLAAKSSHVQEFEALLRKLHRIRLASGLWSRYMRGEVVPQGALINSPNSLVQRIGKVFPDTSFAFHTPLWDLLAWEPSINPTELKSIYLSLGDAVHVHFVARVEEQGKRGPPELGRFWHLKKTNEGRRLVLQKFLDDPWIFLIVCLLEARMAYAAQDIEAFADCQQLASEVLAYLQKNPQFQIKRLRGVLLLMEALCLDALLTNVESPPPINQTHLLAKDSSYSAIKYWAQRCVLHIHTLSSSSRKTFVRRLKNETLVGKMSFFWDL